jgi:hypothetical protein
MLISHFNEYEFAANGDADAYTVFATIMLTSNHEKAIAVIAHDAKIFVL